MSKVNKIGTYLRKNKIPTFNKIIIMKSNNKTLRSITIDDVTQVLISKFLHKGIVLSLNNDIPYLSGLLAAGSHVSNSTLPRRHHRHADSGE